MKETEEIQQQKLAAGITKSDQKAFDELFRAMYPRLVRFAFKITQDWNGSCDITQDVFVMLWQHRKQIDPERSIRAWLYRSVRNRAFNYLRDRRDKRDVAGPATMETLTDDSFPADAGVSGDGQDDRLNIKLYEWINELPDRQREAFELSRFEGLYHHEIAGIMNVSVKTVNNHLTAALKQIRSSYEKFRKASQEGK